VNDDRSSGDVFGAIGTPNATPEPAGGTSPEPSRPSARHLPPTATTAGPRPWRVFYVIFNVEPR
jgi:hypothetical protein